MAECPYSETRQGCLGDPGQSDVHPTRESCSYQDSDHRYRRHLQHEDHVRAIVGEAAVDELLDGKWNNDSARRCDEGDRQCSKESVAEFGGQSQTPLHGLPGSGVSSSLSSARVRGRHRGHLAGSVFP